MISKTATLRASTVLEFFNLLDSLDSEASSWSNERYEDLVEKMPIEWKYIAPALKKETGKNVPTIEE